MTQPDCNRSNRLRKSWPEAKTSHRRFNIPATARIVLQVAGSSSTTNTTGSAGIIAPLSSNERGIGTLATLNSSRSSDGRREPVPISFVSVKGSPWLRSTPLNSVPIEQLENAGFPATVFSHGLDQHSAHNGRRHPTRTLRSSGLQNMSLPITQTGAILNSGRGLKLVRDTQIVNSKPAILTPGLSPSWRFDPENSLIPRVSPPKARQHAGPVGNHTQNQNLRASKGVLRRQVLFGREVTLPVPNSDPQTAPKPVTG